MSYDDLLAEAKAGFEKCLATLDNDFKRLRTGRANPQMLDHIQVDAYGSRMPINQLAQITVPEATQLVVKPFDKTVLKDIEKAIIASDLGLAPSNDGVLIRLQMPPMSTERRQQLAGDAKDFAERQKVQMRNHRRDAIKGIETRGKEQKLPEDATKKSAEKVSELLKQYEAKLETALKTKQQDILTL
jgi:ribosome recycling factor